MLTVIGKGQVVHQKAEAAPPSASDALQALAVLSGLIVHSGTQSEKIAFKTVEMHLRAQAGATAEQKEGA